MKNLKTFENFHLSKVNEELTGLGLLALAGLALAAPGAYTRAKRMWSKYITGSKYTPTGNEEEISTDGFRKKNKEVIAEYKDKEGNIYWGYDHLWVEDPMEYSTIREADLYRSMFRVEDKERLIKFLKGIKVKTYSAPIGQPFRRSPDYDYLDKPEVVDMIFLKEYDEERLRHGNL